MGAGSTGSEVAGKDDAQTVELGVERGADFWSGKYLVFENQVLSHKVGSKVKQSYFVTQARHDFGDDDGTRFVMDDPTLRDFFRMQMVFHFTTLLVRYRIYYEPAKELYIESGTLLQSEADKAPWGDSPKTLEVIAERHWEGKKLCTAARRAETKKAHDDGTLKSLGVPDCCMRDFLTYIAKFGIVVTWPAAEFDATAALRRAQGAFVLVMSRDSDIALYPITDPDNQGAILYPADKSTIQVLDTAHKIRNLCKWFDVTEAAVRANLLYHDAALLLASMHSQQDYNTVIKDGPNGPEYASNTGIGLSGVKKVIKAFKSKIPAAITAAESAVRPKMPINVFMSQLLSVHPVKGAAENVKKWRENFLPTAASDTRADGTIACGVIDATRLGFLEHPVSLYTGDDGAPADGPTYLDAVLHCDTPTVSDLPGADYDASWTEKYEYAKTCPCDGDGNVRCPLTVPAVWSFSEDKLLPDAAGKPRCFVPLRRLFKLLTGTVVHHFNKTIYLDKAAREGTYDPFYEYMVLASRACGINQVSFFKLDPGIDGDPAESRGKLPTGHSIYVIKAPVPQSYGVKGKEKGKMDREDGACYPVLLALQVKDDECAVVPACALGRSRANDGILWYFCPCRNGLLCDHIKGLLVFMSRAKEEDCATNHDIFGYWKSLSPLFEQQSGEGATRIEQCMTSRAFFSDIYGKKVTDDELTDIL